MMLPETRPNERRVSGRWLALVMGMAALLACSGRSTYSGGGIASFSEAGPQEPPSPPGPDPFDFSDTGPAVDAGVLAPLDAAVDAPKPVDAKTD
jgi:hypothetical protein